MAGLSPVMDLKVKYAKNKHQILFHEDLTSKYLHLSTGYGGGKSHALVMKLIQLSIKNRDYNGGLVCPSYADFKRDMMVLIEEICDRNRIKFRYHKTEHWYSFPWTSGKIYIATGEKALKGPNWAFACINELTLLEFERFREVIARVRLKKASYPQIASCGTPEGLLTGFYSFFIENPGPNTRIIYGSTDDNLHNLNADYISSLETAYDQRQLEAFRHGRFVNMQGNRFYYSYSHETNSCLTKEDQGNPILVSCDFNVDPMVATIWQWQMDGSIHAVNEIVLKENADTNKLATALKARGYTPERTEIYPDPAGNARSTKGQPDIVILRNHGFFNIKVRSKAPPFRRRQLNVNNLFEKRKLFINIKACPTMHRDLLLCTQDQVTLEKEKSSPELTHSSDGLDYMADILFEFSGKKPETSIYKLR
jgi:hypothetical protein